MLDTMVSLNDETEARCPPETIQALETQSIPPNVDRPSSEIYLDALAMLKKLESSAVSNTGTNDVDLDATNSGKENGGSHDIAGTPFDIGGSDCEDAYVEIQLDDGGKDVTVDSSSTADCVIDLDDLNAIENPCHEHLEVIEENRCMYTYPAQAAENTGDARFWFLKAFVFVIVLGAVPLFLYIFVHDSHRN